MGTTEKGRLSKVIRAAIVVIGLSMAAYHYISVRFLVLDTTLHQNLHLALALTMVFLGLALGSQKRWQQILWLGFVLFTLAATAYVHIFYLELQMRFGYPETVDVVIGAMLAIAVSVAVWRTFGTAYLIVIILFLLYGYFGHLAPDIIRGYHYPAKTFTWIITTSMVDGIYGTFLSMSAQYVFLFILFGSLLGVSGANLFFEQLGKMVAAKARGGAGLASVVGSGLLGTISGSAVANIMTIGTFTIPLMKKAGYDAYQAAAIEATSSTGALLLPPVLGSTAFVMAGVTGIPYVKICLMITIPSILYYVCEGMYVQLQAMRIGLHPTREKVDYRLMIRTGPIFIIPLGFMTVMLLRYWALPIIIFYTIAMLVVLSFTLPRALRPTLKVWVKCIVDGAKAGSQIATIFATIGVLAGVMVYTGLAIKLPAAVEAASQGSLVLGVLLTAVICLALGAPLPGTAVYILVAIAACPALIKMGLPMPTAHLLALYYGFLGTLTPPVATAAAVASKVAGAPYMKTAIEATKVGIAGFLVPIFMVACPIIILQPQEPILAALGIIAILLTLLLFQLTICGQYILTLTGPVRWLPLAIGIVFIVHLFTGSYLAFAIGLATFVALTFWQVAKNRRVTARLRLEPQ